MRKLYKEFLRIKEKWKKPIRELEGVNLEEEIEIEVNPEKVHKIGLRDNYPMAGKCLGNE